MKTAQEIYDYVKLELEAEIEAAQRRYVRFAADFKESPEYALRNSVEVMVEHIGTERCHATLLAQLDAPLPGHSSPSDAVRHLIDVAEATLQQMACGLTILDGRLGNALKMAETSAYGELFRWSGTLRKAARDLEKLEA
jgi:hypothetical protein